MLVDVGLQDRVEVLEFDVSDQSDDENLEENQNNHHRRLIQECNQFLSCQNFLVEPHQSVEHQRVVRLLVRRLHHDAEEGIQRVLQELPPTTRGENKEDLDKNPKQPFPRVAHLDDLAALHLHQPLQDLLQVIRVGPPVQQTQ